MPLYLVENLQGIRVEHNLEGLSVGSTEILVAKDVDVLAEEEGTEDLRLVSSRNAQRIDKSKFSFADEGEEENETGFVIGREASSLVKEERVEEEKRKEFDTTLSMTVESISSSSKKKRVIRKQFNEEPIFQARTEEAQEMEVEEDDLDTKLAQSRQRNIELIRKRMQEEQEEEGNYLEDNLMETGIVVSDITDFLSSVKRPERVETLTEPDVKKSIYNVNEVKDRTFDEGPLLDEPLVSSNLGVGKALQFLKGRGTSLELVHSKNELKEIKLTYYDEFGNVIDAKEAYKLLSHAFHGNKSGKNKQEKRLKRIEDRKKKHQSSVVHEPPKNSEVPSVTTVKPQKKEPAKTMGFKVFGMK